MAAAPARVFSTFFFFSPSSFSPPERATGAAVSHSSPLPQSGPAAPRRRRGAARGARGESRDGRALCGAQSLPGSAVAVAMAPPSGRGAAPHCRARLPVRPRQRAAGPVQSIALRGAAPGTGCWGGYVQGYALIPPSPKDILNAFPIRHVLHRLNFPDHVSEEHPSKKYHWVPAPPGAGAAAFAPGTALRYPRTAARSRNKVSGISRARMPPAERSIGDVLGLDGGGAPALLRAAPRSRPHCSWC